MDQSKKKKQTQLRIQSENIRQRHDEVIQKVEVSRKKDDLDLNEKQKRLQKAIQDRKKKIKTQHKEQLLNYEMYKYDQAGKHEQVEKRKKDNELQYDCKHKELEKKIELEQANLDAHRDKQKILSLIKQEKRKLKEQDLIDL